jgi:cell division septal protein FtsQ
MTEQNLRPVRLRRHRRLRHSLVLVGLLLLLALVIYALPALHVARIEVSETRAMTRDAIITASGIEPGQHLFLDLGGTMRQWFTLRYGAIENRLQAAFPYIRSVTARLAFPAGIRIDILERIEVAYVSIPDGCVMIDKDAVALRILAVAPENIPVIEGVSVTSLNLGQPLAVDVPDAMHSAVTLMGAIIDADKDTRSDQLLLPQVRKIRPIGGRKLYMLVALPKTGEELTVTAETGAGQVDDMLWLRFAMSQNALSGRGKGVLDLTGDRKVFIPDT